MPAPSVMTRRQLVVAGGALAASAAFVPNAWGRLTTREARIGPGRFLDGVASGEPGPDAVTLWGRLTTDVPRSGARLVVCEDEALTRTVATAVVPTSAAVDHCLKVRVTGLEPSRFYYYAWQSADGVSEVGRTRTTPPQDSDQALRLAFSSCQRYTRGFFNGHGEAAARDDLDLYVFLGDYIYETTAEDARLDPGASTDLASYRAKMRLYRSDPDLRELHRRQPVVHVWDDHEVANDYSAVTDTPSALQQTAGYRASFEWMPRMALPGDRFRVERTMRLGRMAELMLLDERQHRVEDAAGRSILGAAQRRRFTESLSRSTARWKLVGNPVQFTPFFSPNDGQAANPDAWDGYPAERREVLRTIAEVNERDPFGGNVLLLTGDIHVFEAVEVRPDARTGRPIASEFVGGSVTSEGLEEVPQGAAESVVRTANPWIRFFNGIEHGYATLDLDATEARVDFRVSDIATPGAPSRSLASFVQPVGENAFAPPAGASPIGGPLPVLRDAPRARTPELAARRRAYARAMT